MKMVFDLDSADIQENIKNLGKKLSELNNNLNDIDQELLVSALRDHRIELHNMKTNLFNLAYFIDKKFNRYTDTIQ